MKKSTSNLIAILIVAFLVFVAFTGLVGSFGDISGSLGGVGGDSTTTAVTTTTSKTVVTTAPSSCSHFRDETIKAVQPTCTKSGYTSGLKCLDCGEILSQPQYLSALGHSVDDNCVCVRCYETVHISYVNCMECGDESACDNCHFTVCDDISCEQYAKTVCAMQHEHVCSHAEVKRVLDPNSIDTFQHAYKTICTYCDVVMPGLEYENHVGLDENGECSVCGYYN